MSEVSEPVPLRTTLCVQVVQIVVCNAFMKCFDLMLERFATKGGSARYVQRKTSY